MGVTITDASGYLNIPLSTLKTWLMGQGNQGPFQGQISFGSRQLKSILQTR
jgi:hypothetical protein